MFTDSYLMIIYDHEADVALRTRYPILVEPRMHAPRAASLQHRSLPSGGVILDTPQRAVHVGTARCGI